MPNPLSDLAKSVAQKIRQVADAVETYAEAAGNASKPIELEPLAADLLERLAAALRFRGKRKGG
jgi:hypothetical protein